MTDKCIALLFAKLPERGRVKTRLARDLGDAAALAVYDALVTRTWRTIRSSTAEPWLVFDPPDAERAAREWIPDAARYLPQSEGDLGTRMASAFVEAFNGGAQAVIALGTDAPDLSNELIERALTGLAGDEVALGPAEDGGYWCLALARPHTELFDQVPWSTAGVLATTRALVRRHGMRERTLPTLPDVDTGADLAAWERSSGRALPRRDGP